MEEALPTQSHFYLWSSEYLLLRHCLMSISGYYAESNPLIFSRSLTHPHLLLTCSMINKCQPLNKVRFSVTLRYDCASDPLRSFSTHCQYYLHSSHEILYACYTPSPSHPQLTGSPSTCTKENLFPCAVLRGLVTVVATVESLD